MGGSCKREVPVSQQGPGPDLAGLLTAKLRHVVGSQHIVHQDASLDRLPSLVSAIERSRCSRARRGAAVKASSTEKPRAGLQDRHRSGIERVVTGDDLEISLLHKPPEDRRRVL